MDSSIVQTIGIAVTALVIVIKVLIDFIKKPRGDDGRKDLEDRISRKVKEVFEDVLRDNLPCYREKSPCHTMIEQALTRSLDKVEMWMKGSVNEIKDKIERRK